MPPSKSCSKLGNFIQDTPEVIPPSTPSAPARSPSDRLREKIVRDSYSSSTSRREQPLSNSTKCAASLSSTNRSGATVEVIGNDGRSEAMPSDLIAIDIVDTDKNYARKMTASDKDRTSSKVPISANIDKKVGKSVLGYHNRQMIGIRRVVPEGLWPTSKSKPGVNGRVGAFALSQSTSSPTQIEPTTDASANADEEEERWVPLQSSEQCSPPTPVVVGCETISGRPSDHHANSNSFTANSSNSSPSESDSKGDEEMLVLVCGMKTYVFVGIVIAFTVLIIVIVAIAVGASKCSKASLGWPC